MRDLKDPIQKTNNSSPCPDQIHYEILHHLPIETLHILLDIINETLKSDTFPESRREALITSIPKPGTDHFNPFNYRPIALRSCICKTVERMVNGCLVWYLENNGDHVAISRDCPKWKIEKDIVTLKYTEKISFADARKRLQPSFDPSKDSYATVTQTPPQSSRPLPPWAKKIRLPIDFRTKIEYLKYILNYCLTRLDTLDEITPENPVPRVAPSSDETPPPPQTTPEQQNEITILNTESTLQSAASNDVNDENEIEMLTMSNKRTLNEDSSEEDTNNPLPAKKAATSSPASVQSGTRVPKGRGGGDLPKISAFPANAPQSRGRGSSQGDKSPARTPRFSNNTGEGTASSAQSGRNRGPINRNPPLKPPGTIKTATKDKTKSKGKNTNS